MHCGPVMAEVLNAVTAASSCRPMFVGEVRGQWDPTVLLVVVGHRQLSDGPTRSSKKRHNKSGRNSVRWPLQLDLF